jgi:hypothetical protein
MFQCQNPSHSEWEFQIHEQRHKAIVRCGHPDGCWIAQIPPKKERERLAKIAADQEARRRMLQCQMHHDDLREEMGDEHYEKIFG